MLKNYQQVKRISMGMGSREAGPVVTRDEQYLTEKVILTSPEARLKSMCIWF